MSISSIFYAQLLLFAAIITTDMGYKFGNKGVKRGRRSITCEINPDHITDKITPAKPADVISVSCPTTETVETCIFTHTESGHVAQDVKCSVSVGEGDKVCDEDGRIHFNIEEKACGFRINNPRPWDTGEWAIIAVSMNYHNTAQIQTELIEIYTYNQSTIELLDSNGDSIDASYETSFNYNENNKEWNSGKSHWEQVEIECAARGGIPSPSIYWLINGEREKSIIDENTRNGIFNVKTSTLGGHYRKNYIEDIVSKLRFDVDRELLDYLSEEYTMDTNPESGQITFNLHCMSQQGDEGEYNSAELAITVSIRKLYKEEGVVRETIGMVVIIFVPLVFLSVVAILCFAKLTGRWCFEDNGYQDPVNPDKKRQLECRKVTMAVCLQLGGFMILVMPMAYVHMVAGNFGPFKRGFFCDDESLKHPLMPQQVSTTVLLVIWGILSSIIILGIETLHAIQTSHRDKPISNSKTPWIVVELYRHLGFFCLGAMACLIFTDMAKYTVGRLRPHYLTVCDPELTDEVCKDEFGYSKFIVINEMTDCRGLHTSFTKETLNEARLSFLSGHSAFSFYCATFLVVYLQARLTHFPRISPAGSCVKTIYRVIKILRPFIQFGILVLAFWVSLTRISDYFHHPLDVVTGAFVGIIFAIITLLFVAGIFNKPKVY